MPATSTNWSSESFYRVLLALDGGGGPARRRFRPYLAEHTCHCAGQHRHRTRLLPAGKPHRHEHRVGVTPGASAAAICHRAGQQPQPEGVASLADSSRTLLGTLLVEEEPPAAIAPLMALTPNVVSSRRAVRAKDGCSRHFLAANTSCCPTPRMRVDAAARRRLLAARTVQPEHDAVEVHPQGLQALQGPCGPRITDVHPSLKCWWPGHPGRGGRRIPARGPAPRPACTSSGWGSCAGWCGRAFSPCGHGGRSRRYPSWPDSWPRTQAGIRRRPAAANRRRRSCRQPPAPSPPSVKPKPTVAPTTRRGPADDSTTDADPHSDSD